MHKFSANCLFLTPTIAVRNLSNLPKTLKNQDCSKCINYNLGILIRNSRNLIRIVGVKKRQFAKNLRILSKFYNKNSVINIPITQYLSAIQSLCEYETRVNLFKSLLGIFPVACHDYCNQSRTVQRKICRQYPAGLPRG